MKAIFLNPQLLQKFYDKAQIIAARWDYPKDQFFQVYSMVAVIELNLSDRCFYQGDGIVFDGWNGYRHTAADRNDPNPYSAYGGFYRMERSQMAGWSCWLLYQAMNDPDRLRDQLSRCNLAYSLWLEWEPEPRVWGFLSFQDYYTEAEALAALEPFKGQPWVKRHSVEYGETSGCWRLRLETVRRKAGLRHGWKARIAV